MTADTRTDSFTADCPCIWIHCVRGQGRELFTWLTAAATSMRAKRLVTPGSAFKRCTVMQKAFFHALTNWTKTNSLCCHGWINWTNKLTLKDNTVSCCFYFVYMWRTPPPMELQTPSFHPLFIEQLVHTVTENIHFWGCITSLISKLILHFFFQTT